MLTVVKKKKKKMSLLSTEENDSTRRLSRTVFKITIGVFQSTILNVNIKFPSTFYGNHLL